MAPKKKEVQKLSLNDFLNDSSGGGSWADEVEETVGTQQLPPVERRGTSSYSTYNNNNNNYGSSGDNNRGGYSSIRDNLPKLPDKPPFTAHLGNLSYDATVDTVNDFFAGCNIVNVRIIEDREQNRPKGFAYAEFADLEGLKQALVLDGNSFQGRNIRIKVADPPKNSNFGGSDITRDFSDWTRKGPGPLPDDEDLIGTRRERLEYAQREQELVQSYDS
ncbi:hypothetical protein P8C59_000446 [Phyllachora maydis]|uniref:RRM domain-containing protein n=1 Tax=Phyllachora maydis TaxID=1825666 RepID=A0AAD9HXP6_9PEZI|nr:hypothetical protein P8C59_000446 [Phyllachora maydis]